VFRKFAAKYASPSCTVLVLGVFSGIRNQDLRGSRLVKAEGGARFSKTEPTFLTPQSRFEKAAGQKSRANAPAHCAAAI
jgi:hypothetical protein